METPPHPLKALLQLQLSSDAFAVLNLPYVLTVLTAEHFSQSPHLQKWASRLSSLLHSKDPGARWAGLSMAYKTAVFSKHIMMEYAASWLAVALPMLSKNEPSPTIRASVRLIRYTFVVATETPEFQRQFATPNVPKFSLALVALADKQNDPEMKILILDSLAQLVPIYPTLHKALHPTLASLVMRVLNESSTRPIGDSLLKSASRLYSVLHFTGGKVGASNLWRKSVDETLVFAWSAFLALRTTFPTEGQPSTTTSTHALHLTESPLTSIPLQLDQLRCCIVILVNLLGSTTYRPVQVPLGPLITLITALLSCTEDGEMRGHVDPQVRAMELSVIPSIWLLGCELLTSLAKCARHHLTPNASRLVSIITFHLEQKSSTRLPFLCAIYSLVNHCHPFHSSLSATRLVKAILPSLTVILATQSEGDESVSSITKSKKGKKRAREYEGDEVFKTAKEVIFHTIEDGKVILQVVDVLQLLLRHPHLSPVAHSISSRILLSVLLSLPQTVPSSLSPDLSFHGQLLGKIEALCAELGTSTTSTMSHSLGLGMRAFLDHGHEIRNSDSHRRFELLVHPRVPPLVRSLPHVESLSLFRAEENQEETEIRQSLDLAVGTQTALPQTKATANYNMDTEPKTIASLPQPDTPQLSSTLDDQFQVPQTTVPSGSSGSNPPPGPEPMLPRAEMPVKTSLPTSSIQQLVSVGLPMDDDDEDEEMPGIDLDSDSD